ncbi:hypothetical protein [Roseococcus sp. SYP-B2431]|uniref:hypothetical protein n=1 Tax=Roseococcus sp. SYP-B2431 TaxID=2496640 RepID=UPI0013F4A627|nr:hypothetical protein [Roseococcus sp. SYP-B2431]
MTGVLGAPFCAGMRIALTLGALPGVSRVEDAFAMVFGLGPMAGLAGSVAAGWGLRARRRWGLP